MNRKPSDIHQKICDPLGGNDLYLKGLIRFIAPRCGNNDLQMGHYTTICFRGKQEWVEYDDIGPTQKNIRLHRINNIYAVIYFRP